MKKKSGGFSSRSLYLLRICPIEDKKNWRQCNFAYNSTIFGTISKKIYVYVYSRYAKKKKNS